MKFSSYTAKFARAFSTFPIVTPVTEDSNRGEALGYYAVEEAMSPNILRNGFLCADSVTFWLSTEDGFDIQNVVAEEGAFQFIGSLKEQQVLLALSMWKPGLRGDPTDLDQMSGNILQDTKVESGDMMVVLSSREAVELHNLEVKNEAVLVIAQMPIELLQQFATRLGVTFTPSEYGVYKKVFCPSTHIFTIIRNRLWLLHGVFTTIGTLHGRVLDVQDTAANKWKAASADAVQRLERKLGHIGTDDCAICIQSLTVTKANCPHLFHSCLNEWLLEHSDSCPLCRTNISSKEANAERSSTAVGQAEPAHDVINETTDGEVGSEPVCDTARDDLTSSEAVG
ncbi:hypothetical protein VE01_07767 [Pseudogymnoascus verrucosus]|uniref:RING-type domain-containing protein n=1 Tax=Pseudogymnoascus verrucosus TaxID=342668 RepID=A0A1B8GET5_9PEZI|nr:uncharacterized protein VE01_07767 [Pseudogymnoascus verrucosus]OBT94338.1 hypothetical protein VE01_07767 [Pseudogymnoascus verrucosus]